MYTNLWYITKSCAFLFQQRELYIVVQQECVFQQNNIRKRRGFWRVHFFRCYTIFCFCFYLFEVPDPQYCQEEQKFFNDKLKGKNGKVTSLSARYRGHVSLKCSIGYELNKALSGSKNVEVPYFKCGQNKEWEIIDGSLTCVCMFFWNFYFWITCTIDYSDISFRAQTPTCFQKYLFFCEISRKYSQNIYKWNLYWAVYNI